MFWPDSFDVNAACWADYRRLITALPCDRFPDCQILNQLAPGRLCSAGGQGVRFVCSTQLEAEEYERRIFTKGLVSTRPGSWHDLFNALVWMRFPHIKTAVNSLHYHAKPATSGRGRLRDALTLFDESGVILVSARGDFLQAVAKRDWSQVFQLQAYRWKRDARAVICGHALLEKLLVPYKSMTAKALLVQVSPQLMTLSGNELLNLLDREIARQLLDGRLLNSPAQLSPLPLAGISGWDFAGLQDEAFYNDADVFRPPPDGLKPAPIVTLEG